MSPRELIAELETTADRQDELQARLIDCLKSYADASESYLDAIERHAEQTRLSRSSVIAEAAMLVAEQENGQTFRFLRAVSPSAFGRAQ